jgi:hypothetical protein
VGVCNANDVARAAQEGQSFPSEPLLEPHAAQHLINGRAPPTQTGPGAGSCACDGAGAFVRSACAASAISLA